MTEILSNINTWLTFDRMVEGLGFVVGLFYIYYEYHANPRVWIASIIMPCISLWVYFRAGIYADFGINIYYFIIAIYGYVAWTRSRRREKLAAQGSDTSPTDGNTKSDASSALRISHFPVNRIPSLIVVTTAIYFALAAILINFTDSTVPWTDAFTTALNIVGTWMLARKYIEQWYLWMAVEVVSVWLYSYKGIYFYSALYCVYTVICIFGYLKWRRMMAEGK
jgi:nicotinamide mononucleotide transporter